MKYQPNQVLALIVYRESGDVTVSGRQFDWGGRLLKSSGGAQRFPQAEWKPVGECKGKRELDCKTDTSSRDESRA
ncbi:MAG: hypothetical protein B6242_03160 [Anaerolineaceae bacterium 4572_78]|nr:MAG: hypothetical protein B6242_03160 [Anaerolineaceae bacterium 4572_78]